MLPLLLLQFSFELSTRQDELGAEIDFPKLSDLHQSLKDFLLLLFFFFLVVLKTVYHGITRV